MDENLRKEYDTAVQFAPDLVLNESKIADFLRVERNDSFGAATRLAKYWKARKNVFGERWLLPMNQTGHGALSAEDVAILRSGYIVVMPRYSGGIIALFDESRLPKEPGDTKTRIIFYFRHSIGNMPPLGKPLYTSLPVRNDHHSICNMQIGRFERKQCQDLDWSNQTFL